MKIEEFIEIIIYDLSYIELYILTFMYFLFLYFVLAPMFLKVCEFLSSKNILHKIIEKDVTKKQIQLEKLYSLKSIVVFGFSVLPVIYFIRNSTITLLPNTIYNIILGLTLLTVWNEIHFFIVHRTMHLTFFMKNVHTVHHRSKIPTVYSVYSFHWFEAFLLSTVPITIIPFIPFAPIAFFLYPFVSILFNYSGHCNYRFGNGISESWKLLGTHHNEHHYKFKKNYGFASNLLDMISARLNKVTIKRRNN